MPLPLDVFLWMTYKSVVRGLINDMDRWTENKNHYLKKVTPKELGTT